MAISIALVCGQAFLRVELGGSAKFAGAADQWVLFDPSARDTTRNLPGAIAESTYAGSSALGLIAFLNPRIPSARPFPSSGSFFGPNKNNATARITSRCRGWSMPSIIDSPHWRRQSVVLAYSPNCAEPLEAGLIAVICARSGIFRQDAQSRQ